MATIVSGGSWGQQCPKTFALSSLRLRSLWRSSGFPFELSKLCGHKLRRQKDNVGQAYEYVRPRVGQAPVLRPTCEICSYKASGFISGYRRRPTFLVAFAGWIYDTSNLRTVKQPSGWSQSATVTDTDTDIRVYGI